MTARRELGEPLEHIVGWVDFGGLRLSVGPGVFIPRQRSVLLAEHGLRAAVDAASAQVEPVIVEAFCGVAPIAAVIADRLPDDASSRVRVLATDRDPAALVHATRNLPAGAVVTAGGHGLDALPADAAGAVHVLVAVAPYVPDAALRLMPAEARLYEPEISHRGGGDGLDHLRTILDQASNWLAADGVMLLECHRGQSDSVLERATAMGMTGRVHLGEDGQTAVTEIRR